MRSAWLLGDERVGRLEEGRCCEADESIYATQPAACQMQTGPLRWMGKFRVFQPLEHKAASKLQGGFLLVSGQVSTVQL